MIRNEVTAAIAERRSIRKYTPRKVTGEELETILECGTLAPSGMNLQQWFVAAVRDPALLKETRPGCEIHDSATMTLEQVIEVVKKAEAEGKTTVRLHTGDSSIYGAVREQFDQLEAMGVEYDVTPASAPSAARRPPCGRSTPCPT